MDKKKKHFFVRVLFIFNGRVIQIAPSDVPAREASNRCARPRSDLLALINGPVAVNGGGGRQTRQEMIEATDSAAAIRAKETTTLYRECGV